MTIERARPTLDDTDRNGVVTRGDLADGREIAFYDDTPQQRQLPAGDHPPVAERVTSELRRDRMLDEWVVIAAHRQSRTHLPAAADCPLCPTLPDGPPTEVPAADYDVVVFENRFPALAGALGSPAGAGLFDGRAEVDRLAARPGSGRCEVVCFSSAHSRSYGSLPKQRLRTLGAAWADRIRELSRHPAVEHVLVFENRGQEIGVTLDHPHGQIYGYPFVPPYTRRHLEVAGAHRARTGRCLVCDLSAEAEAGCRLIAATEHALAYVPMAARWPYEAHVVPRTHVPDLAALDDDQRDDLVILSGRVAHAFDQLFDGLTPYIAAWQGAPTRTQGRDDLHLHQQIFTVRRAEQKLKHLAGSESAAGVFVNDIVPETAAQRLRAAMHRPDRARNQRGDTLQSDQEGSSVPRSLDRCDLRPTASRPGVTHRDFPAPTSLRGDAHQIADDNPRKWRRP